MKRQEFLSLIAADVKTFVEASSGYFCVAEDPSHPYAVLAAGNVRKWACIVSYAGDGPAGEELPGEMYRPRLDVFVGHCIDLRKDPGAWLHVDTAAVKSLLTRVDAIDDHVREIAFVRELDNDDDSYCNYSGAQPVTLPGAGIPLRAFRLSYAWTLRQQVTERTYREMN